jgi:hypothetical protein
MVSGLGASPSLLLTCHFEAGVSWFSAIFSSSRPESPSKVPRDTGPSNQMSYRDRVIAERQSQPPPGVIIPPRATAEPSAARNTVPTPRDRHIHMLQEKGRRGWQKAVGYGRRSLVETAMFRYKTLIDPTLRSRKCEAQQVEAHVACSVINRMTQLGMPIS